MTRRVRAIAVLGFVLAVGRALWAADADPGSQAHRARQILEATGITGGLIVHVGCGDGKLTAALCASDAYLVHGLDPDAANIDKAREHIGRLGVRGNVSVEQCTGARLPYIDNLVNLVVSEGLGRVPMDEVLRVLAPHGVVYVKKDGQWTQTVKPRPKQIDEWTHYLHDASGNAVAHDSVVGPPRRLQWVGSPRWARHHDHMASMSALVSTGGRIFYIFDEGPTASIQLPPKWFVIARDAFNGTILWKRPIASWHTHLWPLKSGPAHLPRRLVAVGDRVYVTLGLDAPLTALDAVTGRTVRTYPGSKATEEVILSQGVLFLLVNDSPTTRANRRWARDERKRRIMAVQADTGNVLWQKEYPVAPLTLAADGQRVLFHDGEQVVCLDRKRGDPMWRSWPVERRSVIQTGYAPSLVVYRDVVLFSGGKKAMTALSAKTGEPLWTANQARSGHHSPEDLLVVGGLVWSGATADGRDSGLFTGRDPWTGEIKNEFPPDVKTYWFHQRCHPGKATDRYLLPSRTGIEFVDVGKQHWTTHHWVRGGCIYGIMPCNGLIYAPPHSCACYIESKLNGFCALAPASAGRQEPKGASDDGRLERGPAYGEPVGSASASPGQDEWPTYRHDPARSGRTQSPVPADLKRAWRTDLGGRLSSVVIAAGKVFVASVDTHTVHALDAGSGKALWAYTTGGRVDSPPTIHQGRVLFGSADGWVYCLRGSDGRLIWRFRAAPADRRLTSFEQLESVWPVHGSVLVQDDVVYCVAGRSMFLDGGLRLCRLDPKTGRKLSETVLDDRDPESGENLQARVKGLNMPVALPDVLSSDGRYVYMRSQMFDLKGKRLALGPHSRDAAKQGSVQRGEGVHLFCPTGLLDDTWFHRTYWVYGRSFAGGHAGYYKAGLHAPAGRILTFDASRVYGFARKPQYYRWTTPLEHQLFATDKDAPLVEKPAQKGPKGSLIRVDKSKSLSPARKPLVVEAWVKADKPDGVILARGGPVHGYALVVRGGRPRFVVRVSETVFSVGAKKKVVGKWVHLAGALTEDKELQIYVDGERSGSAEASGFIASDPHQAMEIGADEEGGVGDYKSPFGFTGIVDEVRIYHGTLTPDEIREHCAVPGQVTARDADLVLCYSFDKGDAEDSSENKNHGKVEGAKPVTGKVGRAMRFTGRKKRRDRHLVKYHWSRELPLLVRAMVLADQTLFIAGPPDVVDEEQSRRRFSDPEIQAKLAEQAAALEGRKGALLWAVSASDGKKLAGYPLESLPIFDGMAAAGGRLYMSTADGKVLCMASDP